MSGMFRFCVLLPHVLSGFDFSCRFLLRTIRDPNKSHHQKKHRLLAFFLVPDFLLAASLRVLVVKMGGMGRRPRDNRGKGTAVEAALPFSRVDRACYRSGCLSGAETLFMKKK
ncbi:unnamed protein product [Scytosiphon promiscuus]